MPQPTLDNARTGPNSKGYPNNRHSSMSMAEALSETVYTVRPQRTSCRVKEAGRSYLEQNETCQWIQHMTEDTDHYNAKSFGSHSTNERENPIVHLSGYPAIEHRSAQAAPKLKVSETPLVECDDEDGDLRNGENVPTQDLRYCEPLAKQIPMNHSKPRRSSSPKIQDQLPQNIELTNHESMVKRPSVDHNNPSQPKNAMYQKSRRLKGCLAQHCALRDEGTVGSLLYHSEDVKQQARDSSPHFANGYKPRVTDEETNQRAHKESNSPTKRQGSLDCDGYYPPYGKMK